MDFVLVLILVQYFVQAKRYQQSWTNLLMCFRREVVLPGLNAWTGHDDADFRCWHSHNLVPNSETSKKFTA